MTTKTKPAAAAIHGVRMGAVRIALVDAALTRHDLAVGGTDQQKVSRLSQWYGQKTPKNRIADCSTCGGESDVEERACPYCGDGDTEPVVPAVPSVQGTSGRAATEAPVGLVKVSRKPLKMPEAALVPAAVESRDSTPIVVLATPVTEAALDAAVEGISTLMRSAADRLWELGDAIRDVFDSGLWGQRKSDDGSTKYKAWGQFCEVELGISHGYSLKLMDVAREFTRDQVRQIGASKLHITLAVPKGEARDRLLGIAPTTSKVDLMKVAETERRGLDISPRDTGRGKKGGAGTHKGGAAKSGGRKPEKITVAMLTNRVEIVPQSLDGKKSKLKIASPLIAEERLFNGVKQRIVITNDEDGFLLVVVERVRE